MTCFASMSAPKLDRDIDFDEIALLRLAIVASSAS
jgi:hypothetical protein